MAAADRARGLGHAHGYDHHPERVTSIGFRDRCGAGLQACVRRAHALRHVLPVALIAACATVLNASSPKFFAAATQGDFLKGDVENLTIDSNGQLSLGPAIELVYETAAPFLWSMVAQPDGTLFVGTGNEGKVFRKIGRAHV